MAFRQRIAMNKGKVLSTCQDCGEKQYLTTQSLIRSTKPRCPGCGSTFFEISKSGNENLTKCDDLIKFRKRT